MSSHAPASILVVDDEPDIRELVQEILRDEGYEVDAAEHAEAARAARLRRRPDLVLLDIWMPGTDGLALLREWAAEGALEHSAVVMMSGHGTVETAVEATRLGAWDFIEKPIALAKLLLSVERALEAQRLRADNRRLRQAVPEASEPPGDSPAMQALREQLRRVAASDARVLLRGESGTGKEALARWLHALGPRRERPFVTLAPGAIARENVSAVLFGSEIAGQPQYGLIEQASGGTLFIDEVADLDPELQLRLSSVLESKSLLRIGGVTPVAVDPRLVAASSRDLEAEVRAGRFREELFYQLNVLPIAVPPLRERPGDLERLLADALDVHQRRDGLAPRQFSPPALARLKRHGWPGNLRELRNLVQRLLILGRDPEISLEEVEAALGQAPLRPVPNTAGITIDTSLPLREARERFERQYLQQQLAEAGGSVGKLAKRCGLERTHLYRKLRALGIEVGESAREDGAP